MTIKDQNDVNFENDYGIKNYSSTKAQKPLNKLSYLSSERPKLQNKWK